MVFYVYMSPKVIQDANNGGNYAIQALIAILQGFIQNCFIAEFADGRVGKAISSNVHQLPATARKKIGTLFVELKKRKHFIDCIVPDYSFEKSDISCVNDQGEALLLDLLLVTENENSEISFKVKAATLDNYLQSSFESNRSSLASDGKILQNGELEQYKFLDETFKKAFIFATRIEICDRIFGKNYNDNFEYTIKTLFKWLEHVIYEPVQLKTIIIHCEKPPLGYRDEHMKSQLASVKRGRFSNIRIEIRFYHKEEQGGVLPHDRYIMTDQVAFILGRGMDFLDKKTKRNRDVSINYKNSEQVSALLNEYRQWMLEPLII